jgi:flagellar capping protein FliD
MNMWAGIVAIVAMAFLTEIVRTYIKARGSSTPRGEIEALQKRIDELNTELRDRIETLERIVTDDKADLKRQFDRLDKTG